MNTLSTNLKQNFTKYVIPAVVAQWVFALYAMVDGMFVARGVGETALAAVNISIPFSNFLFAISLIIAVGSSTIVSIFYGQKNKRAADETYTQNLITVVVTGLILSAVVLFNLDRIAAFLGGGAETFDYVKQYVGTVAAFAVFFMLGYFFEILIKADGRPKLATILIVVGALTNCVLDYVFVFVIKWGVFGAAVATGISQFVVAAFFMIYFFSGRSQLKLRPFKFSGQLLSRTFKLGLPSGITDFSAGVMVFFFNWAILKHLGTDAVVSYTIVAYVSTILVMTMTGIAQGFQPLVSYEYGRGRLDVAEKYLKYGFVAAVILTLAIAVPTFIAAPLIVSIFISPENTALREYSVEVFRIFSFSFLLVGFNVILSGYFTAVEKELYATIISLARGFIFIVLSLLVLTHFFGGAGIWIAPSLSEGLCILVTLGCLYLYRQSKDTEAKASEAAPGLE